MTRMFSLAAVIFTVFSLPGAHTMTPHVARPMPSVVSSRIQKKLRVRRQSVSPRPGQSLTQTIQKLAGPYASLVMASARANHVSPALVAAVVQVENGGNFAGSATRVSSAGAIGVMQLEPKTAWDTLRVNPWQAASNIAGGARFLHELIERFHHNVRLALMAYNAGPTLIACGGRPAAAVWYANRVLQLSREVGT